MKTAEKTRPDTVKQDADATTARQQALQARQDEQDKLKPTGAKGSKEEKAVQAGAREQPRSLPRQHIQKPGLESELQLAPRFEAPDYKGSEKLRDKVAIITGGDSGIGRAVAVLYAREGADVAIVYLHSDEDAQETCRHVEAEGRRCLLIRGDVRDSAFCRDAVQQTVNEFGGLDILVNNAAFQEHAADIEDISDERLEETLQTNIGGYFHMARAAVPKMREKGCIINTGSVVGLKGSPRLLDYATTKGAIHAFTKSLAQNLISKNIRVNAVAPGPVWTPLNPADSQAEQVEKFGQDTDMKRAAQPEELSPAYVFLASPVMSGYINGIVLPVTGSVGAI